MRISELIARLEAARVLHGDLVVVAVNPDAVFVGTPGHFDTGGGPSDEVFALTGRVVVTDGNPPHVRLDLVR